MILIQGICEYFNDIFNSCKHYHFHDGVFPIEYENEEVCEHPIYNAEWSLPLNEFKVNALYIDLSYEEDKSWIFILQNNDFEYIFKFIDGKYSIIDKNNSLIPLELTANLVSMFEKMINFGFSWKPNKLNEKLLNIIVNII